MGGVIEELLLWEDAESRDGFANMAVDQWLLETATRPTLRIYRWEPGWGSFGYFVPEAEAAAALLGVSLVRRWTGGGIVDHRRDWTYTLVFPGKDGLAGARGGESYRVIHAALVAVLTAEGEEACLAGASPPARGGECFIQASEHDVLNASGTKIAGAGQRRSRDGLLHQGSVALPGNPERGRRLAAALAKRVVEVDFVPEPGPMRLERYRDEAWRGRR